MSRLRALPVGLAVLAMLVAISALAAGSSGAAGLTVRSVGFGVKLTGAGKSLTVTDVVRGKGRVTYLLSVDRKRNRGDMRLGGRRAGGSKGRKRVRVPRSARLGAYRVLACASKSRCRASSKRLVVVPRPRPLRVRPRPAAGAVTQDIGRGGGTIEARGPDGTSFTLAIPDGALLDPAKVTLTPVGSVGGLPLKGGRMLGAVQAEPFGTRLLKAATLTVKPARRGRNSRLTGFAFGQGGRQFHLLPRSASAGSVTLKVFELKGYGVGQATAAARYKLSRTRLPSASINQLQQVAAARRAPRRGARSSQSPATDEMSAMVYATYASLRSLALTNLDAALLQYPVWDAISAGAPNFIGLREELKGAFRAAFEIKLAEARAQCFSGGDIGAIARLLRYRTYLTVLVQVGLADFQQRVNELLVRCLRFEIDYGVSIEGANGYGEGVQARVKSKIPVSMQGFGALDSFQGSAPLEVASYSTGPADCWTHTWEVTPEAPVTIQKMVLDVLLAPGAERAPPTIEVTFNLGSLNEQVTHNCDDPPSSYTDQQHAYDGVTAALLGGEAGQSFTLRWTGGGSGTYASQTFSRSGGGSDGGNYNGTLSFSLRHTPGG